MAAKKSSGGGSLTRSQVVTVRLDPKLKFGAELAARKQRRTLSSFIEWAVEQTLENIHINSGDMNNPADTVTDALLQVWDVEEADRVSKLALYYRELLSYEEEQIWKIIGECGHFWRGGKMPYERHALQISLYFDRVRQQWGVLQKIINGECSLEVLSDLPVDDPLPPSNDVPF